MKFVAVFGSSNVAAGSALYQQAETWGRIIGERGFGIITGGYFGVMEAASRGAKLAGGTVIGVTAPALFPDRPSANRWVDIEFQESTLVRRIERLLAMSAASLTLPGGVGTLAEVLIAWNLAYLESKQHRPAKPIGVHPAWSEVLKVAVEIEPRHLSLLTPVATATEVGDFLRRLEF